MIMIIIRPIIIEINEVNSQNLNVFPLKFPLKMRTWIWLRSHSFPYYRVDLLSSRSDHDALAIGFPADALMNGWPPMRLASCLVETWLIFLPFFNAFLSLRDLDFSGIEETTIDKLDESQNKWIRYKPGPIWEIWISEWPQMRNPILPAVLWQQFFYQRISL